MESIIASLSTRPSLYKDKVLREIESVFTLFQLVGTMWKHWSGFGKIPHDDTIHVLYATRRGLCFIVESG